MSLKFKSKLTIPALVLFLICSSVTIASPVSDNVASPENAEIWKQLANRGNTAAMYNLANYYSSSNDDVKSKKFLNHAAKSGLVQAYLEMNHAALSSAVGTTLTFESAPVVWLKNQAADKYTIQLASSRHEKSIIKIYSDYDLKAKGSYYHYQRSGKDRYAVVYGAYDTVAAAKLAFTKLPEDLRKRAPWVRRIGSLHKIIE